MKENLIKAVAIDDESYSLDTLKWELNRNCKEVELLATFEEGNELLNYLSEHAIDLLFLDINLGSTTGIDLLEKMMPVDFQVIFVTAYDEYAIKAFDLQACHYLLKPINSQKLKDAVDRVHANMESNYKNQLTNLISSMNHLSSNKNRIPIPIQNGVEFIMPDDIIHIEGDNNYSHIHLEGGRKLLISKTLKYMEDLVKDYPLLRIHKSHIVNSQKIAKYMKTDGGFVVMNNGERIPVSRANHNVLNQLFS
jgi:two-component system LytT family response regulator